MPRSEPEPAARPLLVGALMPPLVPPALEVMMRARHHADVARDRWSSADSSRICPDRLIAQRREIVEAREQSALRRLDARIHRLRHAAWGHRRLLDRLLRLRRRRRRRRRRRLHDQLHHSLRQRIGVARRARCRGRNGMITAMIANTMARLRRMTRKRRSISSDGDHGRS